MVRAPDPRVNKRKYKMKYKNHLLQSSPEHLIETNKWRACIQIIPLTEKQSSLTSYKYYIEETVDSEVLANSSAYSLGKLIIDGDHPTIKIF